MRVTKYVKSDGENWMLLKIRCSAHVSYDRLNRLLRTDGWVPWRLVKHKFDALKKKLAATNPTKFPNWKQIEIPMRVAGMKDVPQQIRSENEQKHEGIEILEATNESTPTALATESPRIIAIDPASDTPTTIIIDDQKSVGRAAIDAFINAGKKR